MRKIMLLFLFCFKLAFAYDPHFQKFYDHWLEDIKEHPHPIQRHQFLEKNFEPKVVQNVKVNDLIKLLKLVEYPRGYVNYGVVITRKYMSLIGEVTEVRALPNLFALGHYRYESLSHSFILNKYFDSLSVRVQSESSKFNLKNLESEIEVLRRYLEGHAAVDKYDPDVIYEYTSQGEKFDYSSKYIAEAIEPLLNNLKLKLEIHHGKDMFILNLMKTLTGADKESAEVIGLLAARLHLREPNKIAYPFEIENFGSKLMSFILVSRDYSFFDSVHQATELTKCLYQGEGKEDKILLLKKDVSYLLSGMIAVLLENSGLDEESKLKIKEYLGNFLVDMNIGEVIEKPIYRWQRRLNENLSILDDF